MSGKLAQTHLVRKLMASCETKLCRRTPRSIGTKRICGSSVGTNGTVGDGRSQVDRCGTSGGGSIVGVVPMEGMNLRGKVGAMAGTHLGMLFLVRRECVRFVNFKPRFAVEFGAVIIRGAFVMHWRGGGVVTLCSPGGVGCGMSGTLCCLGV